MQKYGLLSGIVVLLVACGAAPAQDADTVDGFHAYGTPHANALLALNGSARMSGAVIADNSIPGSRLVPGAVTAGRLGNNSVTTEKISDGQVMSADLAAGAVTQSKIANNSVTNTKIKNGTILGEDLGIPVLMGGSRNGYLIGCFNGSTGSSTSGITGYSTAASGSTRGVVGACNSPDGRGVYGVAKSTSGGGYGVYGESLSSGTNVAGVYGHSGYTGVYGYASNLAGSASGVYGTSDASNGRGVSGRASHESGLNNGVYGMSESTAGRGVRGVAYASSGTNYGVYGHSNSYTDGYGVYSGGNAYVDGDLTVTGDKGGYVTDVILNGGDEPLLPGDLVEIVSYAEPVLGEIPVAVVAKTLEVESTGVLGPIDCSVRVAPNEDVELAPGAPREAARCHVRRSEGAIAPGGYGKVVTLGLFKRINVDASYGPIYPGDLLVSSPTPGCAMACGDPGVGTVVGKALGALEDGIGEIPVFVSSR